MFITTIVLITLFLFAVAIIIIDPKPKEQTDGKLKEQDDEISYKYRYQVYPFDDWRFFFVKAKNQEEANQRAVKKFTEMFELGKTIETVFYPVKQQ